MERSESEFSGARSSAGGVPPRAEGQDPHFEHGSGGVRRNDADDTAGKMRWRRVHPLSPLVEAGTALVALIAIIAANLPSIITFRKANISSKPELLWLLLVLALVALLALVVAYCYLAWRNTYWTITAEAVHFRKGIIFKNHRSTPLERVQSVDIVRPLFARIVGVGEIKVESAGGGKSNVSIRYLAVGDLERVRAEILHKSFSPEETVCVTQTVGTDKTGIDDGHQFGYREGDSPVPPLPVEDSGVGHSGLLHRHQASPWKGTTFFTMDTAIFVLGTLISSRVLFTLLVLVVVVGGGIFIQINSAEVAFALSVTTVAAIVIAVITHLQLVVQQLNQEFNFTAAITSRGIRLTRGLTKTNSLTIPPGRVHAVRLEQPLLWRPKDWWRVRVVLAGFGAEKDNGGESGNGHTALLPIGSREQALKALWLVVRDLGVEDPDAFLKEALTGSGTGEYFTPVGRRCFLFDPLTFHRKAGLSTRTVMAIRDGLWDRKFTVIPHEHAQSVTMKQGPLQRLLKVATVRLDLVPNMPVSGRIPHLRQEYAGQMLMHQAKMAELRAGEEPFADWQQRMRKWLAVPLP